MKPILNLIKKTIELSLIFFYIIFEELIWGKFIYPVKNKIEKIISKKINKQIQKQNRYVILFIFLLPYLIAESMGLFSAILIAKGLIILAVIIYVVKIAIAAISFWIFQNNKEKLLSIYLFRLAHTKIVDFFVWVQSTEQYILIRKKIKIMKNFFKEKIKKVKKFLLALLKDTNENS